MDIPPCAYSAFFIPFFIHEVNFTLSFTISPIPNSYWCSSLYPCKIIFLLVGHLISTLLSCNSLNLLTPLLILVHLLLVVGLQGKVIFAGVGLFPGLCGFVLAAPAQQKIRHGGQRDPQSTSWGEGSIKE